MTLWMRLKVAPRQVPCLFSSGLPKQLTPHAFEYTEDVALPLQYIYIYKYIYLYIISIDKLKHQLHYFSCLALTLRYNVPHGMESQLESQLISRRLHGMDVESGSPLPTSETLDAWNDSDLIPLGEDASLFVPERDISEHGNNDGPSKRSKSIGYSSTIIHNLSSQLQLTLTSF